MSGLFGQRDYDKYIRTAVSFLVETGGRAERAQHQQNERISKIKEDRNKKKKGVQQNEKNSDYYGE